MIDLLKQLSASYYLDLGDYKFSPVMKLTAGMAVDYCSQLNENKCQKEPFYFCFPEKKVSALWTSIVILTNYYLADYIDVELDGINFRQGDKVQIYGCIAKIESISQGDIVLKFKDDVTLKHDKKFRSQLSYAKPTRTLNLYKKYSIARKKAKENRNPISEILEPNSEVLINQRNLKSKVLLIAGRGQVKAFHDLLKTNIYGEKLSNIFPNEKNLIITPDLKPYLNQLNSGSREKELRFIDLLYKAINAIDHKEVKNTIQSLIKLYNDRKEISQEFEEIYLDLFKGFEGKVSKLKFLHTNYPGISEDLSNDIRAVVLNDITQAQDYQGTLKGFLSRNIPVIVISNRSILNSRDLSFYYELFKDNPDCYRLNWNKKKIESLLSVAQEEHYLDQLLWDQCIRYLNQDISITTNTGCELDAIGPRLLKHMRSLDEFEILQKSFYKHMYPAIYALKNSKCTTRSAKTLISKFKESFSMAANQIPEEITADFNKAIEIAENFEYNSKNITYGEDTFAISVPLEFDDQFTIPSDVGQIKMTNPKTKSVSFTGYPFNEYMGKYLINSVCVDFVPQIDIQCWPLEASLTYNYLKRRIEAGYFTDNLTEGIDIKNSLKISAKQDIQEEISSFLHFSNATEDSPENERDLAYLHKFKYKGYYSGPDSHMNWKVNCDVLNFEDGSFMFLPKGSSLLCQTEATNGKLVVLKKSADQLYPGDIILRYVKDRGAYVEISKRNKEVARSYEELEYWRDILHNLYEQTEQNIWSLESLLVKTKAEHELNGNPVRSSLLRWLFDDDLIKPDNDNLHIIFSAAGVHDIDLKLQTLEKAYKIATAHRIHLSSQIKKKIIAEIPSFSDVNQGFKIKVNGESIDVETRLVVSVDRNGINVDYRNTRKVIC